MRVCVCVCVLSIIFFSEWTNNPTITTIETPAYPIQGVYSQNFLQLFQLLLSFLQKAHFKMRKFCFRN
jgi:hypothetical protein